MKTEHTPEPWSYGEDNDGWYVEKDGLQIAHGLSEEDARRIVACVNACEDILDYELSLGCVARLSEQLRTITKQRDDLQAALDSNQSRGVSDVIVERQRQINIEGWSSDHDDQHSYGEMALAAGCYVMFGRCFNADNPPKYWPWDKKWWKPSDKRRNLVKAAALIIAEIERIDRAAIASVKEKQNAAD